MKIDCQEHYDKVVEYAKSIGDTTFQNCIDRLKQWETNSQGVYEIELYYDCAVFIRICASGCGRKQGDCRRAAVSWQTG